MKLPFIKFYPRDWQADSSLRSCSLEARGVWIEILCIMAQSDRHGYLSSKDGKPIEVEILARLIGGFKDTLYTCLQELECNGVFDREKDTGVLYSRRMVREHEKREFFSECGKAGGGNPKLSGKKPRNNTNINTRSQIPDTRSHISIKGGFKPTFKGYDSLSTTYDALTPAMVELAEKWVQYKAERNEKYKLSGMTQLLKKILAMGEQRATAAVENSMACNYTGLFEPKQQGQGLNRNQDNQQPQEHKHRGMQEDIQIKVIKIEGNT